MPKPPRLNFKVRRTPSGARLTFTAPFEDDGKPCGATDFEIEMDNDELRKLYDETAKAVAAAGKANRRAKRVLADQFELFAKVHNERSTHDEGRAQIGPDSDGAPRQ